MPVLPRMHSRLAVCAAALLVSVAVPAERAKALEGVVASIAPVHSLVTGVMAGVAEPDLIVTGTASPHDYALRPSDAENLQNAPVVFWVGSGLETFLAGPLENLSDDTVAVALSEVPGVELKPFRESGVFKVEAGHDDHGHDHGGHDHGEKEAKGHDDHGHDHGDHDHGDHDHGEKEAKGHDDHGHDHGDHDHGEKEAKGHDHGDHDHGHDDHDHGEKEAKGHDDHGHDDHGHDDHGHSHGHHGHDHGEFDPHVWLDPTQAKGMTAAIVETLSEADPDNAATYRENGDAVIARLDALQADLAAQLGPVAGKPFIVFHDAYQYFETAFGLTPLGAVTLDPETPPGARRLADLRDAIADSEAACVFSEPQFDSGFVTTLTEGLEANAGVLDPLGATVEPGADHYFSMMRANASAVVTCLGA